MIVARGVTPAILDDAAEHVARRRERREGPAAQVMRFDGSTAMTNETGPIARKLIAAGRTHQRQTVVDLAKL